MAQVRYDSLLNKFFITMEGIFVSLNIPLPIMGSIFSDREAKKSSVSLLSHIKWKSVNNELVEFFCISMFGCVCVKGIL